MRKFLSMVLSLLLSFSSCSSWNSDKDIPAQTDTPHTALVEQTPEPSPTPTPDPPEIDIQSQSSAAAKDDLLAVDSIDGNSVLTVDGTGVYYEFDDHGYMSVGLDGTAIPYDVYYGIGIFVNGSSFDLTWHDYSDSGVTPTTLTWHNLDLDDSESLGNLTIAEGRICNIDVSSVKTGPYEIQVGWSNDTVTSIVVYKNGDDLYTCQSTDETSEYICYWYDRKDAIDDLLAAAGVTPENSLDYSDSYWAYPVPADYGEGYRCDNSRWIGLAQELTTPEMSDAQKAIVIHDWMVANLAYDKYKINDLDNITRATTHKDYSGKYSMWDTKVGVCADFTTVYCIMLRSLGIPAVSLDRNDEHVWNVVYLDGDWVEIDLTEDIDRIVYTEDVTNISCADDTIDYGAFGTPYTSGDITSKNRINVGVYTYSFVTGKN